MPLSADSTSPRLDVQVSGKQMAVGEALRQRIVDGLSASIGKYFEQGGDADVRVSREGHLVCVDIVVRLASGQRLVVKGAEPEAHAAFDAALAKVEARVRRYKRRLVNHKPQHAADRLGVGGGAAGVEVATYTVLRASDDEDDGEDEWGRDGSAGDGAPEAAIIAETQAAIRTTTVSMAVMDLDLSGGPVVLFRNVAHGGLSVVYRRADGNIGWLDPERSAARA